MKLSINLGDEPSVKLAFSYPNIPTHKQTLSDTVLHWCTQMLERDGLTKKGVKADVIIQKKDKQIEIKKQAIDKKIGSINTDTTINFSQSHVYLQLEGDESLAEDFAIYAERLPKLLHIGLKALNDVFPKLDKADKWDPENTGKWRFFLPLGLPLVKQKSLQFFHYPPIRLLDPMQNYLQDPVPVRWEELLMANGLVTKAQTRLYETVIDSTPIAAPDDQGSKVPKDKKKYKYGLIPIEYFTQYQKDLVKLLLNESTFDSEFTIPIVIYGKHPREEFETVFLKDSEQKLGINKVAIAEIIPGKKTAVLAANHPYRFYAQGQIDDKQPNEYFVGCGKLAPGTKEGVTAVMKADLAAARWQILMADNPSKDPQSLIEECENYWEDEALTEQVNNLVAHQGSLFYPDPDSESLEFEFKVAL